MGDFLIYKRIIIDGHLNQYLVEDLHNKIVDSNTYNVDKVELSNAHKGKYS